MTNNIDIELQRIFKDILDNGEIRNQERTGVGTKATFFQTLRFDAREFAPISQLRRIAVKSAIAEGISFTVTLLFRAGVGKRSLIFF